MKYDKIHEVISIRHLTTTAYVLRISRRGLSFRAGQHILLGLAGSIHNREYSIYSGEDDPFFEVLIKEVEDGMVSKQLKKLLPGDKVQIEGPLGFFTIKPELVDEATFLFVATGTGIAPFHSFLRSYPSIRAKIVHGVRHAEEAYDSNHFNENKHIICTSVDKSPGYHGRVTAYVEAHPVSPDTHCYLCGNFNMIHEMFELLEKQGVPAAQVHAEVYF